MYPHYRGIGFLPHNRDSVTNALDTLKHALNLISLGIYVDLLKRLRQGINRRQIKTRITKKSKTGFYLKLVALLVEWLQNGFIVPNASPDGKGCKAFVLLRGFQYLRLSQDKY